jgi:alanine racemase
MYRSEISVDLAALRRNCATLLRALNGAELWAVVKANGYGHGAGDAAGAALNAGAAALCVATVPEGLVLRREQPTARVVVMGPATSREIGQAREARLELVVSSDDIPPGVRVHVKLDTGMGRWGLTELTSSPSLEVVGLMSHLAAADSDAGYTEWQVERSVTRARASTLRAAGSRCTGSRRSVPIRARTASSRSSRGRRSSRS